MAERNLHEKWGQNVNVQFRELLRKAAEANAVPLGQERLTPKEARARFAGMGDAERQKFIAERGESEVLRMLRGK